MCVERFLSWRAGPTQDAGDALFEAILAVVPVSRGNSVHSSATLFSQLQETACPQLPLNFEHGDFIQMNHV